MKKLLPLLIIVFGVAGGGGAGFFLRPAPEPLVADAVLDSDGEPIVEEADKEPKLNEGAEPAFVKLNNQFVVPVVSGDSVSALVVLSLTLETEPEFTEMLYSLEPKIRDIALRELFNHAYAGGFDGYFTAPNKLNQLRRRLVDAINTVVGDAVSDVLIIDIIRQDT